MNRETPLMQRIQEAVNTLKVDGQYVARVRRNTVGFDAATRQKYGMGIGSPDLLGVLIGSGRALGIEVKTATGRLTKEQKAYGEWMLRSGAVWFCSRDPEHSRAEVMRAIGA